MRPKTSTYANSASHLPSRSNIPSTPSHKHRNTHHPLPAPKIPEQKVQKNQRHFTPRNIHDFCTRTANTSRNANQSLPPSCPAGSIHRRRSFVRSLQRVARIPLADNSANCRTSCTGTLHPNCRPFPPRINRDFVQCSSIWTKPAGFHMFD